MNDLDYIEVSACRLIDFADEFVGLKFRIFERIIGLCELIFIDRLNGFLQFVSVFEYAR